MHVGVAVSGFQVCDLGLIKVAHRLKAWYTLLLAALFVSAVISDELWAIFIVAYERLVVFLVPTFTSQSFLKRKVVDLALRALLSFLSKESRSCRLTCTKGRIMRASSLPGSFRHRCINLFQTEFILNDIFLNIGYQIRRSQEGKLKTKLHFHSIDLKWWKLTTQLPTRLNIV